MDSIVWKPGFCAGYDFKVLLDRNFSLDMIRAQILKEMQDGMNKVGNFELERMGEKWKNPYKFHERTCFVSQIYIGHNGVWLSTNYQNINELERSVESTRPIEYHSHNVDLSKHTFILMLLFGKWVEYADILKKK